MEVHVNLDANVSNFEIKSRYSYYVSFSNNDIVPLKKEVLNPRQNIYFTGEKEGSTRSYLTPA
jgi:hypothetical protein